LFPLYPEGGEPSERPFKNSCGYLQISSRNVSFDDDGRPVSNTEYVQLVGNNINRGIDFAIKRSFKHYTG